MKKEERGVKEKELFRDLFFLSEALEVLWRRHGTLFNFRGGCQELIDEEKKVNQELANLIEEGYLKGGDKNERNA